MKDENDVKRCLLCFPLSSFSFFPFDRRLLNKGEAMRNHSRRRLLLVWVLALSALLLAVAPTRAQPTAQGRAVARPATPVAQTALVEQGQKTPQGDQLVSVIVKLDMQALAAYDGSIAGLAPTSPSVTSAARLDPNSAASQRYLAFLDGRIADFERALRAALPDAQVVSRYRMVFGGVAVLLPERQIERLAQLPGVVDVQRDELIKPHTDRSPAFIGADVIWQALAADPALGDGAEGVVVGVIDTGIWPEHPSFADDGSYPPPTHWRGECEQPEDDSPPITCTNKLIGARKFLRVYKLLIGLEPDEFDSPRDDDGHGTHTASTAAGNAGVEASIFGVPRGVISGIAPRAYVAAYKALGASGGLRSDLVSAIDQAVFDGVDVINYSIGSTAATDPYRAADSQAFLDAYAAGVFVAVSAGNSGPDPSTIGSPANAPWVMSVAASTHDRQFVADVTLQSGADQLTVSGVSITPGVADKPVVNAATLGDELCENPLPDVVSGTIVICKRGVNARAEKSFNVAAGGGAGMILYNPTVQDVETDNHWVPTVHLDAPAGTQVVSFTVEHSGTMVLGTLTSGEATIDPSFGDVMAAFSSRGPLPPTQLGISKPDVTAPGVQILAGNTPEVNSQSPYPDGELFQAIAGTSMSSPHVAGAGALLKALHPDWSPGQIKSALMTTAFTNVVKEDGSTPAGPYDMGSGRIDLTQAGDPGITFEVRPAAFALGQNVLPDLNYPSISIPAVSGSISVVRMARSTLPVSATWTATTEAPPGATISVSPATFTVPAGGQARFTVTINASGLADGTYFGEVLLQSDTYTARLPVSFTKRPSPITLAKQCAPETIATGAQTDCTITASNTTNRDIGVLIRDSVPASLQVISDTVTGATLNAATNELTYASVISGVLPATIEVISDTSGTLPGYLPLASLGIAPSSCSNLCDDVAITYIAPAFTYNGQTYDRVTMVTNGYLGIGSGTDVRVINQSFPEPDLPNNVIAPYWTDLDLDGTDADDRGAGTWSAAYVTFAGDPTVWFVGEWTNAARYNVDPAESSHTFQVWIEGGGERIYMAYGPNTGPEDSLTVGAENEDGTVGDNYYVDTSRDGDPNGSGTLPVEGDLLQVLVTPEQQQSHTISFSATGTAPGTYVNTARLNALTIRGTVVATATVTVEP